MRIIRFELTNFRGIHEMTLEMHPQMNVLVGVNGAGKSTILDAMAIMLSRMVSLIRSGKNSGKDISVTDISAGKTASRIRVVLENIKGKQFTGQRIRYAPHTPKDPELELGQSEYPSARSLGEDLRKRVESTNYQCSVPVLSYYQAERIALKFPRFIHTDRDFSLMSVYRDSLACQADYRVLLEWFREREDAENREFKRLITEEGKTSKKALNYRDPQLEVVRKAWSMFMPEFSDFTVVSNPLRLEAKKNGLTFRIEQLSDGEKSLLALVGDMARRLAIANPNSPNALEGDGVILVDEIDLHLHPKRQREIVPLLMKTFPNCQFIMATHSPQILGHVRPESIFLLVSDDEGIITLRRPKESLGMTSNEILEDLMDVSSRDEDEEAKLLKLFELIERRKLDEAKQLVEEIRSYRRSEPKLLTADARIQRLEMLAEKEKGQDKGKEQAK